MKEIEQKTILLVEDEAIIAMAESNMLKGFGYNIIIVNSGEKAIEIAFNDDSINLILMDINLGNGIDGTEAARQILSQKNIPILFLTSHSEREMVEKVRGITRYGYVIKNSGDFVLQSSIEMAFELFDANKKIKESEKIVKDNERFLTEAQKVAGLGSWEFMVNQNIIRWSEGEKRIFGIPPESPDLTLEKVLEFVHPDDRNTTHESIRKGLSGEAPYEFDSRIILAEGSMRYIHTKAEVYRDPDGKAIRVLGTTLDITNLKEAEEKIKNLLAEKEILLKEIHHRIKNNMNTIETLLSLQCQTLKNPESISAVQDAKSRLQCMRLLYDKLYQATEFKEISIQEYLTSLISYIIDMFKNNKIINTKYLIKDFKLSINILFTLGIIINELITNIMKYAFINRNNGLITISAYPKDNQAIIIIEDNGIGIPDDIDFENSKGFGLQLINILSKQIGTKIKIERNNGTKFIMDFSIT